MFKESGHVNGFTCVINYNVCTMALYDWINPCICTLGKLILCVFFLCRYLYFKWILKSILKIYGLYIVVLKHDKHDI